MKKRNRAAAQELPAAALAGEEKNGMKATPQDVKRVAIAGKSRSGLSGQGTGSNLRQAQYSSGQQDRIHSSCFGVRSAGQMTGMRMVQKTNSRAVASSVIARALCAVTSNQSLQPTPSSSLRSSAVAAELHR